VTNDFQVLQTYEELGQACEDAVVSALLSSIDFEPPPTKAEWEWAEDIARRARQIFLSGLDAA
jgi:hypothetical protein